jgi:hypothetical protein
LFQDWSFLDRALQPHPRLLRQVESLSEDSESEDIPIKESDDEQSIIGPLRIRRGTLTDSLPHVKGIGCGTQIHWLTGQLPAIVAVGA